MFVGQALAGYLRDHCAESIRIVHLFPVVVAKSLFIDVAKQVIWLHADIGAVEAAFQQTPKVFNSIGMYVAADVLDRVINDRMIVVIGESLSRTSIHQ